MLGPALIFNRSLVSDVKLNLDKLMKSKERAVSGLTKGIEFLFKKNGVTYVKGHGTLESPTQVKVKLNDGKDQSIQTKNILLATGSEPSPFPGLTVDEKQIVTSTGALSLEKVPEKMLVIGGGVIGLELGSVWSRLGAKVTVVEYMPSIGAGMDGEMAYVSFSILLATSIKNDLGNNSIKFLRNKILRLNWEPRCYRAKKLATKFMLTLKRPRAVPKKRYYITNDMIQIFNFVKLEADVVLVSIGRRPYTENLGLEKAGVKVDERGRVLVDEHFKTNVSNIRAIGDIIAGPMLAHKAEEEGNDRSFSCLFKRLNY